LKVGTVKGTGTLLYKKQKNGVGVIFYARDTGRHLFLLRSAKSPGEWGLPGGKSERGETLKDTLRRECLEEIGYWPEDIKLFPIEQFTSADNKFVYHTFYSMVDEEFIPKLNHEHIGFAWVNKDNYPKPLHRGLFNTLNYKIIQEKIALIHESIK
jgi:8-oxo-dGTP pyrophosphatase MutT (NUDIX family)